MNRLLLLCGSLALASLLGQPAAAVLCVPGSLQDYIDLGAGGCEVGAVSLTQFFVAPGQSFATPIDPTSIQVTPGGTAETPTLQLGFASSAGAGELLEAFFHFSASAPTLFAGGIAMASAAASGDGVVLATQDLCPDGTFAGNAPILCSTSAAAQITFLTELDSLLEAETGFAAAGSLDVFTDITIDGGLSGSASLGSVTLSFGTVPEPSTAALCAFGLALLARSRARRSPRHGRES